MNKKVIIFAATVVFAGSAAFALAENITLVNPLCPVPGAEGCIDSFPALISQITKYVSAVVASLAVLVLVWAGILFLTSAGNPEQIGKAKNAAKYAVIGIVIALAATGLVEVIKAVIGAPPAP